jgi:hypothetical protein
MYEETDIALMPSYKFGQLFERMSVLIDFHGCISASLIERKMKSEVDKARIISKTSDKPWQRRKFGVRAERIDTLIEHGFAERAIREAVKRPRGAIALTLLLGGQEAQRIVRAQRAAAARAQLRLRAPSPRIAERRPEFRRTPTYRRWWRKE